MRDAVANVLFHVIQMRNFSNRGEPAVERKIKQLPSSQSFINVRIRMTTPKDARIEALINEYLQEFDHISPANNMVQPFIRKYEESEMVRCVLCSTTWMNVGDMQRHIDIWYHREVFYAMCSMRAEKWRNLLKTREQTLPRRIRERSMALGHPKWTQHVSAMSYEYLISSAAREHVTISNLSLLLDKYVKMEKLSILELAVLKSARNSRNDLPSLHDLGITCGLQVIIPLVKSFLGEHAIW